MIKPKNEMLYEPSQEEKELVDGCLKGDSRQQRLLFEKYYGRMLGVCQRYTVDRDQAKDILQEAFIKIFQKMQQFKFNSPLEAWMRRITVNTAIDRFRKNSMEPTIKELETSTYHISAEGQDVVSDIAHTELLAFINELPAGYKMVFNLYIIEGFSHKEIAEQLGITEGTSKSQLAKARNYMQKLLAAKFATGHD